MKNSASDIKDYFEYTLKTHGEKTINLSLRIYINKENRIVFIIKTWYYLELLIPETKKLLGSTKSRINKNQKGKKVPHVPHKSLK